MAKGTGMDLKDRKLHLNLSELAVQKLNELKVTYPFASRRALATHILEQALLLPLVPSGLPRPPGTEGEEG